MKKKIPNTPGCKKRIQFILPEPKHPSPEIRKMSDASTPENTVANFISKQANTANISTAQNIVLCAKNMTQVN